MSSVYVHPLADVQSRNVGSGTRIWQFVVVLSGAKLGANCNVCSHCFIENDVIVGDRVTIKSGVQLWDGLRIGNDVFIGPNVTFTNDKYPISRNTAFVPTSTIVEDGVSIGGGACILPGVRIGAGATIGAGAVVTEDVLAQTMVVGNPARDIKQQKD
jgi:UDP-2-acetamido-3-amino-2,3-dideoxy-glucuronate N-acetyltransferase